MYGLKKHVELIEPIPDCLTRLRDSGPFPFLKLRRDGSRGPKDLSDDAVGWCVSFWRQSIGEVCDDFGTRWAQLIKSGRSAKLSPGALIDLHSRVIGCRSPGFRKGPIAVDENGPYGFVSAAVDVPAQLSKLGQLVECGDSVWRVVLLAIGLTFLHPFGDGNGRLTRVLVAAQGEGFSRLFAIAFARRMKAQNSKEFAEALAFLRFGDSSLLEQFCKNAVSDLEEAGLI